MLEVYGSHERPLRSHKCIGMVDKAPNQSEPQQQLSQLRCSAEIRLLIWELRGASRHCMRLTKSGVYLRVVSLLCIVFDSVLFIKEFQVCSKKISENILIRQK